MNKIKEEQKRIRNFFAGIFIDKERLKENNINYPIRLEYYKTKNTKNEYGIEVVKTEYREGFIKYENDAVTKVTTEEDKINNMIYKLKENLVTPIELKEVVNEMMI